MNHPLHPHYLRQLVLLRASETHFLSLLDEFQHFIPWLRSCLAGVESDSRQRAECLHLLATAQGIEPNQDAGPRRLEEGFEEIFIARGTTERRALALRYCAQEHRRLVNGYRVARELANRLGQRHHAERIDALLTSMTDAFPALHDPAELPGLAKRAPATAG